MLYLSINIVIFIQNNEANMSDNSINANEILKFKPYAHTWSDEHGPFKILHQINKLRLEYINSKIKLYFSELVLKNLNLLDVGCGGGLVSEGLGGMHDNITAIDALAENISQAKSKTQYPNIEYICGSPELLLSSDYQYDVVLCLEMLEHVDDYAACLGSLSQLTKPGGLLILSTINRNLKARLLAIFAAEYLLNWVPKGTHDYHKFIKPSELVSAGLKADLILSELRGLSFDVNTQLWHLSNDLAINYFACFLKPNY